MLLRGGKGDRTKGGRKGGYSIRAGKGECCIVLVSLPPTSVSLLPMSNAPCFPTAPHFSPFLVEGGHCGLGLKGGGKQHHQQNTAQLLFDHNAHCCQHTIAIHLLRHQHLLELYQECMDNCGWPHVLHEVRGGYKSCPKSTKLHQLLLPPPPPHPIAAAWTMTSQ